MAPALPRVTGHNNDRPGMIESTNLINHTVNGDGQHRPRNERALEKFRQVVLKIAELSGANTSSAAQKTLIEQRLEDFISNYHIPIHPPYAAMIQKAIQELNEKGGSSAESISNFITREFDDLPWAHSTFLSHHLRTLSEDGDIIMNRKCCYVLGGGVKPKKEIPEEKPRSQSRKGRSRGRVRVRKNVEEVIGGYEPFHVDRDELTENMNDLEKEEEGMLVEEVNRVPELPNEFMKEQNDVILDLFEQVNPVMDVYHVPLQLQNPEVSLSVTPKEPDHAMVEQIFETENPCNGLCRVESEQENSSVQVQTELQNEGPLQLGGQHIPPESESTLQATLNDPSNLDWLDKEEDIKLPNSETDNSVGQNAEMPKLKKAVAPVRRFTRSLLIEKQSAGEHVEDSSGAPMGELIKTELTMASPQNTPVGELTTTYPQNSCTQGEPAQCGRGRGRGRGRPPKPKLNTPVGALTMADPQNPRTPGEPARRGRPPKRKANTPVGEVQEQPPYHAHSRAE